MNLYCERCGNKVGERDLGAAGVEVDTISVKVRGQRRRVYVVQIIASITCDWCDHTGTPLPSALDVGEVRILNLAGNWPPKPTPPPPNRLQTR